MWCGVVRQVQILTDRETALCSHGAFPFVCMCSDTGERGGPGEAPDSEDSVSLQSDRTAGDRQDGLPPGLCGPQRCGKTRSADLGLI